MYGPWTLADGVLRGMRSSYRLRKAASREDGLGPRATLTLSRAQVSGDTLGPDRSLYQGQLELSETRSRASFGVVARLADAARPFRVDAYAAWHPLSCLILPG